MDREINLSAKYSLTETQLRLLYNFFNKSLEYAINRNEIQRINKIMDVLKEHDGTLRISDKTSPERIYSLFGVSKKRYKSAIGALYKKRLIKVEDHEIRLVPEKGETLPKTRTGKPGRPGRRIKSKR